MEVCNTSSALQLLLDSFKAKGLTVGFVPTMGYLHEGHLSLVKSCKEECDICVVSIYVNPSQFNEQADFKSYPKDIDRDLALLQKGGCDVLWLPSQEAIETIPLDLSYQVNQCESVLEGLFRKGHFKGVIEVVYRLFKTVMPHKSFFGEKDYQQFVVIKAMVTENKLPIQVIAKPTLRESDGLALSSRNVRLSEKNRKLAPLLYKQMLWFKSQNVKNGAALELSKNILTNSGFEVEYFTVHAFEHNSFRLFVAARLGDVRLIDNIAL